MPDGVDIRGFRGQRIDEILDEVLLVPQFDTGINCFADSQANFAVEIVLSLMEIPTESDPPFFVYFPYQSVFYGLFLDFRRIFK